MALMCHETCEPCKPFQLAYIRFSLAYMYIVLRLAKWYIMLLAVSFVLGLGFSGLLKFKASRIFILLLQNATQGHSTTENTDLKKMSNRFFYKVDKCLVKKQILNASGNKCV